MALIPNAWEQQDLQEAEKIEKEAKEKRKKKFVDEFSRMTIEQIAELMFEMKEEIDRTKEKDRTFGFGSDLI